MKRIDDDKAARAATARDSKTFGAKNSFIASGPGTSDASGTGISDYRRGGFFVAGFGRRTSSPPQFGQTDFIALLHSGQNVHS